ncbi:MAG: cupin domain-containing protein [Dehalococcoidia bacterium]
MATNPGDIEIDEQWHTVTDDERYRIRDIELGLFTVSETTLRPGQSTRGHAHPWPEVYLGTAGFGMLYLDGDAGHALTPGSRFLVAAGVHHRVASEDGVTFTCVFAGERREAA